METRFWEAVDAVDWDAYPRFGPDSDGPANVVPEALRALDAVRNELDLRAAYNFTIDAVGHNHSGWLFPVLEPALPLLLRMTVEGGSWSRLAAGEVLIDVLSWLPSQATGVPVDRILDVLPPWRDALRSSLGDVDPARLHTCIEQLVTVLDEAAAARGDRP